MVTRQPISSLRRRVYKVSTHQPCTRIRVLFLSLSHVLFNCSIIHSRCLQYKKLQDLVSVYELEPDNSEKIMDCMKEVQEFGLPPSDIIADVAPDLTLDEHGIPQLQGMPDCCVM